MTAGPRPPSPDLPRSLLAEDLHAVRGVVTRVGGCDGYGYGVLSRPVLVGLTTRPDHAVDGAPCLVRHGHRVGALFDRLDVGLVVGEGRRVVLGELDVARAVGVDPSCRHTK